MITIHDKRERSFNTLALGILHPTQCIITEELNGLYEMELQHPYDVNGTWKYLTMQNIIYAPTPDGEQPFRIYRTNPDMDTITVYARHIFYDLLDNIILHCDFPFGTTAKETLQVTADNLELSQGFSFYTDVNDNMPGNYTLDKINGVEALIGPYTPQNDIQFENRSFISKFKSEIIRDKFQISMVKSRGQNRGFELRYGKNLLGLQVDEDCSDIITRIYPFGKDGEMLSTKYVDSAKVGDYVYPKSAAIVYQDAVFPENNSTDEEIDEEYEKEKDIILESFADVTFMLDKPDIPQRNIVVDFQMLSRIDKYKDYKHLENIYLGDTIKIINDVMNFEEEAKVIAYTWDAIAQKYNSMEFGNLKAVLTSYIDGGGFYATNGTVMK